MSRASVVGACAAAAGGALAIGLLKRQFATATRKTAGEWLRDRVRVVPHSVLGTQLKTGGVKVVAPAPEAHEVIVDPAGLPYVSGQRPPGAAGAASASIYKFLGLAAAPAFPDAVVAAIARAGDAKLHAYGERKCVHVVGPDFRELRVDAAGARTTLAGAYANVLREVADAGAPVARLLPVSGGVFSGHWALDMHHLTFAALALAYDGLDAATRAKLDGVDVLMCIFVEAEHAQYSRALAWRAAA